LGASALALRDALPIYEAVKLGDRIAILQQGSKVVQYDTPEEILTNPADDFVKGFVGHGAALKQLTLTRVRDVDLHDAVTARAGGDRKSTRLNSSHGKK